MDGLEELQSLSALAKVTEMIKNYLDVDQPELAEFIIHLAKKAKDVEDFNGLLDENEANMSYDFVNQLYRTIIALDPPKKDEWDDIIKSNNDQVNFPALGLKNDPNREELKLQTKNELSDWARELLEKEKPSKDHKDREHREREERRERRDRRKKLEENEVYSGRVVRVCDFGVFVEFETSEGYFEGLVHVSQISEKRKIINVQDVLKRNDRVYVKVLSIDSFSPGRDGRKGRMKIGLTMKYINQTDGTDNSDRYAEREFLDRTDPEDGKDFELLNNRKRKYVNDIDRWENQQLLKSGILKEEDKKRLQEELMQEEEQEEEVEINLKPPQFLKGQTIRSGIVLSPIKLVAKPEGSLSRAIATSLAIQQETKMLNMRDEQYGAKKREPTGMDHKTMASSYSTKTKDGKRPEKENLAEKRRKLPVYKLRNEIVEKIKENKILIVIGETGSGKTTQIPQYLCESDFCKYSKFVKMISSTKGPGAANKDTVDGKEGDAESRGEMREKRMIGITQPRRVSCISIAKRVSDEMGCILGNEVGYCIRFDDCTSSSTLIKYLTDGMLLREILHDPFLYNYSTIMLDEAHERTFSTDVLFALLKETCLKRNDFRLIVTSATLESEKFSKYFFGAEIFRIPGRSFPVEILHSKEQEFDYLESALSTALNIHLTEELGDILVFLTGEEDIENGCKILNERMKKLESSKPRPLKVLKIYSALSTESQSEIFSPPPEGGRKCILATNIAEASITIDGILYVIDTGLCKVKSYNPKTGMESLVVAPISQANARQRAGRAGRTAPGKCYRLYTEATFYDEMLPTPVPEIQRINLTNVVIILKAMGINDFIHFDFMDRPCNEMLIDALDILYHLGALDDEGLLTRVGRKMAQFPIDPTLSKVLLTSIELDCCDEIITIISMLSFKNIFYRPSDKKEKSDQCRLRYFQSEGDHLTYLHIYRQWQRNSFSNYYCYQNFLQYRALLSAQETKKQLISILDRYNFYNSGYKKNTYTGAMNKVERIQKSICSGFFHHSAKRDEEAYRTLLDEQNVYIHPSSSLYRRSPEYVIYHELVMTTKEYMRDLTVIKSKWLLELAPTMFVPSSAGRGDKVAKRNVKIQPLYNKYDKDQDSWRLSKRRL